MSLEEINIEDELSRDYIDYSMSVIVGRALPDVRDGLKPVHRRCLYAMYKLGNTWNSKHLKSARIVGDVIGKYHPHGDTAVYDTIVRMAQDFSLRIPLVDGHGNFGSVDGDPPAAMRYTEVRMHRIAEELLSDLEKDTVDMMPNYDETTEEPSVLPGKLPNLLLNGCSGIAVGMATNIPPHNLGELCDGIDYYIQHRDDCTVDDLMQFVKGPDFPTGAQICGHNGINAMYKTGRGQLTVRGKAEVVTNEKTGRQQIVITEIPYAVNKAEMIKHAAELVKAKIITGISDIRDESKADVRIVVDVKRDAEGEIVLNSLYKHTQLQTTFGANMLALDGGRPKVMNLKEFFKCYADHRFQVITRRTRFELDKAEARRHILDGLLLAIDNLDEVVSIIRASQNRDEAKKRLQERFGFSDPQVNAILEMRLYQLTGLERGKLADELAKLLATIADLQAILADPERIYAIIREDLADLKLRYCAKEDAKRRTEIVADENEVTVKDLIPDAPCVITLSNRGYVKRVALSEYREQRRGGSGVKGAQIKEEDFIRLVFVSRTHDALLFFTNTGRLFIKDAYQIPEAQKTSFGRPLVNLLQLQEGEKVLNLLTLRDLEQDVDVMFATKNGIVKRTHLSEYKNVNRAGKRAINIEEGDELKDVRLVRESDDVVIVTENGMSTRFSAGEARRTGRISTGVIGIRLRDGDRVVSMDVVEAGKTLFIATSNGFAKRTPFDEFRKLHRGGHGVIAIRNLERNGKIVAAHAVAEDESFISITSDAQMVRSPVNQIPVHSRVGTGNRIVRLKEGASLVSVSICEGEEKADAEAAEGAGEDAAPETPQEQT